MFPMDDQLCTVDGKILGHQIGAMGLDAPQEPLGRPNQFAVGADIGAFEKPSIEPHTGPIGRFGSKLNYFSQMMRLEIWEGGPVDPR